MQKPPDWSFLFILLWNRMCVQILKVNNCKKTIKNVGVLHKNNTQMLIYRLKIAKMGGNINIKKMIDKIIMTKK